MKGTPIPYSEAELSWLEARCTEPRRSVHEEFCKVFGRNDVSLQNVTSLCKRNGWFTGRTGQFAAGQIAHNKGKKCPPGKGGRHPNSRRTQFKKGQVPHTFRGAGHERIDNKDGYVIMIVDELNPWTGAGTRPVHKHRYLWEKQNGPIPEGHVLKCLDGDKTNTDPSNWEAIPRTMLPYLGGFRGIDYDAAEPEVKPAIMAIAKLRHKARLAKGGDA